MKKRRIIAILLLISLISMPVTAILIHKSHGELIEHTLLHLHILSGVIFTILGIIHIVLNWKLMKKYLIGK